MFGSLRNLFICSIAIMMACPAYAEDATEKPPLYDLVLKGGRVMDAETGMDAVRNVGVTDGTITAISINHIRGVETIDVTGQIVSPGFIDVHNHSPSPLGQIYQARDGVTTSLELEAGSYPVAAHGAFIRRTARINYGASTGHTPGADGRDVGREPCRGAEYIGRYTGEYRKGSW